jgi:hypothetical protein
MKTSSISACLVANNLEAVLDYQNIRTMFTIIFPDILVTKAKIMKIVLTIYYYFIRNIVEVDHNNIMIKLI